MKTISALILCSFSFIGNGQQFGQAGTLWQHCILPLYEIPPSYDYIEVRSVKDTTMFNLPCHELQITHDYQDFPTGKSILICDEIDKVYYVAKDSLHLLYDFSLNAGDSYTIRFPIEFQPEYLQLFPNADIYFKVIIDSTNLIVYNNRGLYTQYISIANNNHLVKFGNTVTELIGFENWILPFYSLDAHEKNIFTGLHQFANRGITYLNPKTHCLLSADQDLRYNYEVLLFPIPTSDFLLLQDTENKEFNNLSIYDLSGMSFPFELEKFSDNALIRFELNAGFYILEIRYNNGKLIHSKFLVGE